jgi:glycosyltransferase involved in cell wall biosynthesis
MRVLLSASHRYPADDAHGVGLRPRAMPSGSGGHIHDLIARGLAELGHAVSYLLRAGAGEPLPTGVRLVAEPDLECELYHSSLYGTFEPDPVGAWFEARRRPWVATCHLDRQSRGLDRRPLPAWTVFVSPSLARAHGSTRFVWNGLDPDRYVEGAGRRDYLLFVAALDWAHDKGLDTAIDVARRTSQRLLVAGTARTREMLDAVTTAFAAPHVEFLGDVRGLEKVRLYAGARALLCPSRLNEGCPLAIIEALMSGTPVIASREGACPDMVTSEVGAVCRTIEEYVRGVEEVERIPPAVCRRYAIERYHYRRMVADYLREYQHARAVGAA